MTIIKSFEIWNLNGHVENGYRNLLPILPLLKPLVFSLYLHVSVSFGFSNWKKALVFVYIVWFVYFYKTKKLAARCPSLISFKVVLSL